MKWLIRSVAIHTLSLFLLSQLPLGFSLYGGLYILFSAGAVYTVLSLLLKPLLQLLSLPLNFVTFGLFTYVINGIVLWVLQLLVKEISIRPFTIPGVHLFGFVVPKIPISSIILAYIILAAILSGIVAGVKWIAKE